MYYRCIKNNIVTIRLVKVKWSEVESMWRRQSCIMQALRMISSLTGESKSLNPCGDDRDVFWVPSEGYCVTRWVWRLPWALLAGERWPRPRPRPRPRGTRRRSCEENRQAKQHHKGPLGTGSGMARWLGIGSSTAYTYDKYSDCSTPLAHLVHLQTRLAQNTWCRRGRLWLFDLPTIKPVPPHHVHIFPWALWNLSLLILYG